MTARFEIEWMGGVSEHHFRRVRPESEIDWERLDPAPYRPEALRAARKVWTDLALSEYAAIASFAQMVRLLAEAQAPLDMIGMTSDFVADEVKHVELASRVVMRLGGAAACTFEPTRLVWPCDTRHTPLQRANELALRVGAIGEAFASATAIPIMRAVKHPVVREVYETILRDEARHCRFGSLYFEWASTRWDEAERLRLAAVALDTLRRYACLALRPGAAVSESHDRARDDEALELGWFESARYTPLVEHVIRDEIAPALVALGLPIEPAQVEAVLELIPSSADSPSSDDQQHA